MAQIKVGSTLAKPKGIHAFSNGSWLKNKIGKVFHNYAWTDFIQYILKLYEQGKNNGMIGENSTQNIFDTVTWNSNNVQTRIYFSGGELGDVYALVRTQDPVDLTDYKTVYFDCSVEELGTICSIGVTDTIQTSRGGLTVYRQFSGPTTRAVYSLDVSDLSGFWHIQNQVYASTGQVTGYRSMRIYNIWVE